MWPSPCGVSPSLGNFSWNFYDSCFLTSWLYCTSNFLLMHLILKQLPSDFWCKLPQIFNLNSGHLYFFLKNDLGKLRSKDWGTLAFRLCAQGFEPGIQGLIQSDPIKHEFCLLPCNILCCYGALVLQPDSWLRADPSHFQTLVPNADSGFPKDLSDF